MANLSNINNKLLVGTNGEVRIGDTATVADVKLRVKQTANQWAAQILSTGGAYGLSIDTSATAGTAGSLQVYNNTGVGFIVQNDGKVGIGTFSPGAKLTIGDPGGATTRSIQIEGNTSVSGMNGTIGYFSNALYISNNYYYNSAQVHPISTYGQTNIVQQTSTVTGGNFIDFNVSDHTDPNNAPDTRMRILDSGNVGIGTDSPTARLNVKASGSTVDQIAVTHSGNTVEIAQLGQSANGNSAGALLLKTNGGTDTVYLDAAGTSYINGGNVGIGTTSPSATEPTGGNLPTGWTRTGSKALEIAAPDFANSGLFLRNSGTTATGTDITGDQYFGDTYIDNRFDNDNGSIYFRTKTAATAVYAMVIKGTGNVGIGTTSPSATLHVDASGGGVLRISRLAASTTNYMQFENDGTNGTIRTEGATIFRAGSAERMRITSGGDIWQLNGANQVGTYAPWASSFPDAGIAINVPGASSRYLSFIDSATPGYGGGMRYFETSNYTEIYSKLPGAYTTHLRADRGAYHTWLNPEGTGNVGIGTAASPGYKLEVNGNMRSSTVTVYDGMGGTETGIGASAAGGYLRLYTGGVNRVTVQSDARTLAVYGQDTVGSNFIQFLNSVGTVQGYIGMGASATNDFIINCESSSVPIRIFNGGSERMRITSAGHILLGNTTASLTSDPGFKYIDDANIPYFGEVVNTSTGNGYSSFHHYNTNATFNGFRFYILNNGGIVNYSSNNSNLSDERVKNNIEDSGNYLNKICSIPVRLFNYKDEPKGTDKNLGVIAQEVEAVAPELVNNDGFGETPEDGIPLKTVYSNDMMYALMKSIQELEARIKELENK